MAMATTLVQAAHFSYAQLNINQLANTLTSAVGGFATAASALFPDSSATSRPVGNWLVLIDALKSTLPAVAVLQVDFNQIVEYIARMCLAAFALNAQTPQLITNAQVTALLAAWNTAFGT